MIHRPFLRSAIQVVGDFQIGDFDLQSFIVPNIVIEYRQIVFMSHSSDMSGKTCR